MLAAAIAFKLMILILPFQNVLGSPLESAKTRHNNNDNDDIVVLVLSNQSQSSLTKSNANVTIRDLFDNPDNPGKWNKLLQPALDEFYKRCPVINIRIE